MIKREQSAEPEKKILEQIAALDNEALLKLREKFDALFSSLDNIAFMGLLTEELDTERRTFKWRTEAIRKAINQEYGRRLLNGYKSQYQRLLIELEIQQPVVRKALIVPFPGHDNAAVRLWMVCINGQREATVFLDGIAIIMEKEDTRSLEALRCSICEHMSEQDRYTEVFATLDLDQTQLRSLVHKQEKEGAQP